MTREMTARWRRALRAWFARGAAVVVAMVMLVGVLRAGSRYVYCPSMQMVSDAPCCAGDKHRGHDGHEAVSEIRSRDCCEGHVLGQLPQAGGTTSGPQPFAAPLVATLPPPGIDTETFFAAPPPRFDRECRAGPIALLRHRNELMVALN